MSHTLTMRASLTSLPALQTACTRLGLAAPQLVANQKVGDYDKPVSGYAVQLTGWRKPVVFNLGDGDPAQAAVHYDNWEGRWGDIERLYDLQDTATQESIRLLAAETGQLLTETMEEGNVVFILEDPS